jgi:hypothetical protein
MTDGAMNAEPGYVYLEIEMYAFDEWAFLIV